MDKESVIELQKIDCNCNDCKFMERNIKEYDLWSGRTKSLQYFTFLRNRRKVLLSASELIYGSKRKPIPNKEAIKQGFIMLKDAFKMTFQFDRSQVTLAYGNCQKLSKSISFIPNTLQLETQQCFEHRRN